jgi:nucleosome binding factor SPN SPT16 subunit
MGIAVVILMLVYYMYILLRMSKRMPLLDAGISIFIVFIFVNIVLSIVSFVFAFPLGVFDGGLVTLDNGEGSHNNPEDGLGDGTEDDKLDKEDASDNNSSSDSQEDSSDEGSSDDNNSASKEDLQSDNNSTSNDDVPDQIYDVKAKDECEHTRH